MAPTVAATPPGSPVGGNEKHRLKEREVERAEHETARHHTPSAFAGRQAAAASPAGSALSIADRDRVTAGRNFRCDQIGTAPYGRRYSREQNIGAADTPYLHLKNLYVKITLIQFILTSRYMGGYDFRKDKRHSDRWEHSNVHRKTETVTRFSWKTLMQTDRIT